MGQYEGPQPPGRRVSRGRPEWRNQPLELNNKDISKH